MSREAGVVCLTPLARCPKKLHKIVADAIALWVLTKSLPILIYWTQRRIANLDYLHTLKNWYWIEGARWMGQPNSKMRHLLSRSFMNVLDDGKPSKTYSMIFRIIVQALFCVEVGHLEREPCYKVRKDYCLFYQKIFNTAGPFYYYAMHDVSLFYLEPMPQIILFRSSPYLRNIHLFHNMDFYILDSLRRYCKHLELLKIDIETLNAITSNSLELFLFQTFFENMSKGEVFDNIEKNLRVGLTFKHLKHFYLRYDFRAGYIKDFVVSLQRHYPDIKIQLTSMIAAPFDDLIQKLPFASPSLVMKNKDFKLLRPRVFYWGEDKIHWEGSEDIYPSDILSVDNLVHNFLRSTHMIQDFMYRTEHYTLTYMYCSDVKPCITKSIAGFGEIIQELYLYGALLTAKEEHLLAESLNGCPNLRVLSLLLNISFGPSLKQLKLLKNLRVLAVGFTQFRRRNVPGYLPVSENDHITSLLTSLIPKAPELTRIEMTASISLRQVIDSGVLSNINVLSLTGRENLSVRDVRQEVERLPSLKLLLVNRDFGYDAFLLLKKSMKNFDLEVVFKNERLIQAWSPFLE